MSQILDRIRKLFAHADSASAIGNQAEAEAFAAKAAQLLAEHKIDRSAVSLSEEPEEAIVMETVLTSDLLGIKTKGGWRSVLAEGLSRAYFVRLVIGNRDWKTGSYPVYVFGKASDREVFTYALQTLIAVIEEAGEKAAVGRRERTGYRLGFAVGICQKLRAERIEQERSSNPHAVVLASAREAVAKVVREAFPNTVKGRASRTTAHDAYAAGKADGAAHNFRRGVYGGKGSNLQLGGGR